MASAKSRASQQQREEESHWFALAFTAIMGALDGTIEAKIEAYRAALGPLSLKNSREEKGILAIVNQNTFRVREEKLAPIIAKRPRERRVALGRALVHIAKPDGLIKDRAFLRLLQFSIELQLDLASLGLEPQDLSGARLNGLTLARIALNNISLRGADLRRVDLRHSTIDDCDLSGVDLTYACLIGADLGGVNLSGANLTKADLSRANLIGANLSDADLSGANLSNAWYGHETQWPDGLDPIVFQQLRFIGPKANLRRAGLSGANLSGVDLRGANLSGVNLSGANLSGANLSNANVSATDLSGVDLSNANLSNAKIRSANLSGANLSGANLSGANLRMLRLGAVKLNNISLRGADLRGVYLKNSTLTGCDLSGADLTGAKLSGATISQSDLRNVNLKGASVLGAKFFSCNLMGADVQDVHLDTLEALSLNSWPSISPLGSLPPTLWVHMEHRLRRGYRLQRTNRQPDRAAASYVNNTRDGRCPFPLNEHGHFIAMIDVEPIRAATPWLVDVEAVAVFQSDGRNGSAVAITRSQVAALDAFDSTGLSELSLGRAMWDDVAEEWIRALDIPNAEEHVEASPYEGTKLGGHYAPVQSNRLKRALGEQVRRAALLCQIDFDDGARLPDAGLLYVFTYPDDEGRPVFVVHGEYC